MSDQLRQPSTNTGLQHLVATDSFQHLCVDFDRRIHLIIFFLPISSCSMPGSDDVEPAFPCSWLLSEPWQHHTFPLWHPVDSSETHCHCRGSSLSSELLDFKLLSIHFLVHGPFLCIIYFIQGPELLVFSRLFFSKCFSSTSCPVLSSPHLLQNKPCSVWSCVLRSCMYCLRALI